MVDMWKVLRASGLQVEGAEEPYAFFLLISTKDFVNNIPKTEDVGKLKQGTRHSTEHRYEGPFLSN